MASMKRRKRKLSTMICELDRSIAGMWDLRKVYKDKLTINHYIRQRIVEIRAGREWAKHNPCPGEITI